MRLTYTHTHVNEIRARLENASRGIFRVCRGARGDRSQYPQHIYTKLLIYSRQRRFSEAIARKDSQFASFAGGHALAAIATLSLMRSPFQKMPWHAIRSVISFSAPQRSHTSFNKMCYFCEWPYRRLSPLCNEDGDMRRVGDSDIASQSFVRM
jgi:hypothetical protein